MSRPGLEDPAVLEFAVFCIENLARRHNKGAESVFSAIARPNGILDTYIVPSYDFLHTQDKEYILDDIDRALAEKGISL